MNTLRSWKLFYKKSSLPKNYNNSIWMSKTQLMTIPKSEDKPKSLPLSSDSGSRIY